jgi:hypothetical protein
MRAALLEFQARAGDEVLHGVGDQDLARTRHSSYSRTDVNCDERHSSPCLTHW